MKNLSLIFALVISMFSISFSAEVPDSLLTPEQKTFVAATATSENVSWLSGIGTEIGVAVNSSMSAITTQTNNFAKTDVGRITIALVVFKVIHKSVAAVLGIFLFWLLSFVFVLITWFMFVRKEGDKEHIWKITYCFVGAITLFATIVCLSNI